MKNASTACVFFFGFHYVLQVNCIKSIIFQNYSIICYNWYIVKKLFLKGGRVLMQISAETLTMMVLGFAIVILLSLAVIITLWIKTKRNAYAWFLAQVILLTIAFLMFIGIMKINSDFSKAMSTKVTFVAFGIIGILWTFSMLCMLLGIFFLGKEKIKAEEPNRIKIEYNPSFIKAIGMLVIYSILLPIIPAIILIIASKPIGFSMEDPLIYVFITIASLGLLILWLKRKYIINIKSMFSMEKISIIFLIPMTITIVGLGFLLSEVANFTTRVLPMSDFWLKIFNSMTGDGFAPWKGILGVVVVAPIVEEIIFRGIVLRGFLKHYSVRKSILLSALLFGIIHMNPWQFVGAFVAGIILGWWYVKTNSITTTIFGHALNNGMSFIIGAIGLSIPGYNAANDIATHQPVWFDLLGVILLAAGIMWLVRLFKARKISSERIIINAEDSNS